MMERQAEPTLAAKIDMMAMTLDSLDVKVERLDDAIRGNGQLGISTRMALLDRRVDASEAFINEFRGIRRWVALGILAMFGTMAWNVIEWFIQSSA